MVASAASTPRFRRITLAVDDPEMLTVPTVADATVGVYFGDEIGRSYSVRLVHPDGRKLDIEVFLHGTGPGTAWAQAASPGDRVRLDHPNGWYSPALAWPGSYWPPTRPACPRCAGSSRSYLRRSRRSSSRRYSTRRISRCCGATQPHPADSIGRQRNSAEPLAFLVAETALPVGQGYCWCAGEVYQTRAVRKYLRSLGWGREDYDITGYWRHDAAHWEARFAPVADEMMAVYRRARADGMSEQAAMEAVDEALEREGL